MFQPDTLTHQSTMTKRREGELLIATLYAVVRAVVVRGETGRDLKRTDVCWLGKKCGEKSKKLNETKLMSPILRTDLTIVSSQQMPLQLHQPYLVVCTAYLIADLVGLPNSGLKAELWSSQRLAKNRRRSWHEGLLRRRFITDLSVASQLFELGCESVRFLSAFLVGNQAENKS